MPRQHPLRAPRPWKGTSGLLHLETFCLNALNLLAGCFRHIYLLDPAHCEGQVPVPQPPELWQPSAGQRKHILVSF